VAAGRERVSGVSVAAAANQDATLSPNPSPASGRGEKGGIVRQFELHPELDILALGLIHEGERKPDEFLCPILMLPNGLAKDMGIRGGGGFGQVSSVVPV
jgi:hypothetical protein